MSKIEIDRSSPFVNSIILSIYMLLNFFSGMKALAGIEVLINYSILGLSFLPVIFNISFSYVGILMFLGVVLLSIIQGSPALFFVLITAPLLASFSLKQKFNLKILYIAFGIICIVLLVEAQHDALDDFKNTSRNYVSVIMLFNSMLISLIAYNQTKKILIWPYFFAFFFSLLAIGRAGILCSSFCFLGILMYKIHQLLSNKMRFVFISLLFVLIISSIPTILEFYEQLDYFERIRDMGLEDDARDYIWKAYMSSMNVERLFMGYDLSSNAIIHRYGDNPHNSYIFLHAHMGVLVFVPLFLVLYSLFYFIRKKKFVYFIPLIAILLRGYTDIIFLSQYDFIVLIFVMYAFMDNKQQVEKTIS